VFNGFNDYAAKLANAESYVANTPNASWTIDEYFQIVTGHSQEYWQNAEAMYNAGLAPTTDTAIPEDSLIPSSSLVSDPTTVLPMLDTGTNRVPQDMLAILHQDEAVLPSAFNPWAGGKLPGSDGGNAALAGSMQVMAEAIGAMAKETNEMRLQLSGQRGPLMVNVVETV
jgi:hypothetical protein